MNSQDISNYITATETQAQAFEHIRDNLILDADKLNLKSLGINSQANAVFDAIRKSVGELVRRRSDNEEYRVKLDEANVSIANLQAQVARKSADLQTCAIDIRNLTQENKAKASEISELKRQLRLTSEPDTDCGHLNNTIEELREQVRSLELSLNQALSREQEWRTSYAEEANRWQAVSNQRNEENIKLYRQKDELTAERDALRAKAIEAVSELSYVIARTSDAVKGKD